MLQVVESIATNITWYEPESGKLLLGSSRIEVFPSPKSQNTSGEDPSDVKSIEKGGREHKVVSGGAVAEAKEKLEIKWTESVRTKVPPHSRSQADIVTSYSP